MKGLVLDTTIKGAYVVAFDGEREAMVRFDSSLSTQSALIPACEKVLSELGLLPADLDGVAAVVGPGSFTGIRIGVTFANALAFALSLPRFSLTSFDVMCAVLPRATAFAIDAGHGECYAAFLENGALVERNVDRAELPADVIYQEDIIGDLPQGALLAARKAMEERTYSACAPTCETSYLKPNYRKKSQAERLKEEKK